MTKVSPVIQDESLEARKTTAFAMSCGCPMRPSGVCASTCLRISLSAMPAECVPSVSTSSIEQPYRGLRSEDHSEHIQIEMFVEVLLRHVFQRREFVNARVVHQ